MLRLDALRALVAEAAAQAGRAASEVRLIGVAKTRSPSEVVAAVAAGLTDIGENYLDESLPAIAAVAAAGLSCTWHFVGHLQSNKTRLVALHYDWVHSIDRLRIAERLADQRNSEQAPLQVLIQTNFDRQASKSGVTDDAALFALAHAVHALPQLKLRGLMTIPPEELDPSVTFARTHAALTALRAEFERVHGSDAASALDTLSMGMSDDFSRAVAAGSTMVRIGTALFGPRPAKPPRTDTAPEIRA